MFTLCLFMFASVTAVDPISTDCVRATQAKVSEATRRCSVLDKDPLTTCETQRMGALKVFIRVRQLEGT